MIRSAPVAALCFCAAWMQLACRSKAQDAATPEADFFERQIRPLLVENCHACHGPEQQKGGLRLDSRAGVLAGGDSGPAVVPGQPQQSLLIEAVKYEGDIKMPPKGRLNQMQIEALVRWVAEGAVWPEDRSPVKPPERSATASGGRLEFTEEQKSFWAFQPLADPQPPEVEHVDWVRSPIDQFVLARLEAQGLAPNAPAERRTLIRRLSYDLIGLPPTPEEIDAFLADTEPEATERLIDRLLASPHYGERWGRHWLDVARYADSNGLDENLAYANAFRYRDYVIDAFNADLPYDQFVREQIAGDLLPPAADERENLRRITATGFLAVGPKMLAEDDPVKMEMDIIDEQVDTLCTAFLGLTMGCARCHHHKYDPLGMDDYYALAGIFKSTKTMENYRVVAVWHERPLATQAELAAMAAWQSRHEAAQAALSAAAERAAAGLREQLRSQAHAYMLAAGPLAYQRRVLAAALAQPLAEMGSAAMMVEAEAFTAGNLKIDVQGYGEAIGVVYNAGELPNFCEYEIDLPEGFYQLELRYAAAEARPVQVVLDGVTLVQAAAGEVTGSWYPDTQRWFAEAVLPLSAGRHTLRLIREGPFPHLDKVALVSREVAGLVPADVRSLPQVAAEAGLLPPILAQWQVYLERAASDPQNPFHAWAACQGAGDVPGMLSRLAASPVTEALRSEPIPATLDMLAGRYRALLELAAGPADLPQAPGGGQADSSNTPEHEGVQLRAAAEVRKALQDDAGPLRLPQPPDELYAADVRERLAALRAALAAVEKDRPDDPPLAMAVSEREPVNLRIHIRGSHLNLGEEVPRRFPRILAGEEQPPLPADRSGRLELAEWLTRPGHPLLARVMVNRIWRWHFGAGLVRSTDNFGLLGERPTHPELLDWLACRFIESGWSIKAMHRLILSSSTWQQSTAYQHAAAEVDPDNRLLWRMNRRRLEAEALRDALLSFSGRLDRAMHGSLLGYKNREYVASTASVNATVYDYPRRSVYLPVVRSALYEVFQAFDFPEPSVLNGDRPTTTVAPQALFLMNSPLVRQECQAMAEQLLAQHQTDEHRITLAYLRAYGRPPTSAELARDLDFLAAYQRFLLSRGAEPGQAKWRSWEALARVIVSASEFVFID